MGEPECEIINLAGTDTTQRTDLISGIADAMGRPPLRSNISLSSPVTWNEPMQALGRPATCSDASQPIEEDLQGFSA